MIVITLGIINTLQAEIIQWYKLEINDNVYHNKKMLSVLKEELKEAIIKIEVAEKDLFEEKYRKNYKLISSK